MLEFGVMNNAGFTVITGEIGAGKTTLLRCLLRRLHRGVNVGLISNTPQGREELLQWVLMSLNQPFEGSYSALFFRFQQFLKSEYARNRRTIVIIDEAQNLEPEALEALRMLSNINADKDQFLQIILVGQPQLKALLSSPKLTQFAQRIAAEFHLRALNSDEVSHYIDYRLRAVGAHGPLFSRDACAIIAEASRGIPRTVNILCDTALVYGFAIEARLITKEIVTEVLAHKRTLGVFAQ
jgi:type II secretory pathway predicted ATPase ExeA